MLETNPYLKDPEERKRLLRRSLVSSFAIEGIEIKAEETSPAVKEAAAEFIDRTRSTSSR